MLDSGFQMAQSKIVYFISRQRLSAISRKDSGYEELFVDICSTNPIPLRLHNYCRPDMCRLKSSKGAFSHTRSKTHSGIRELVASFINGILSQNYHSLHCTYQIQILQRR
jgi:hypothetical protein